MEFYLELSFSAVKWLHQLKTDTDQINHSHLNQNESDIKLELSNVIQYRILSNCESSILDQKL